MSMDSLATIKLGRFLFQPTWVSTLCTLLIFPLLVYLGFWQLDRYAAKVTQIKQLGDRIKMPALLTLPDKPLSQETLHTLRYRQVEIRGSFINEHSILLDNQILKGKVGYRVLTPFQPLNSARWLFIDRGWITAGKTRANLPSIPIITEELRVSGMITLPVHGLRLKKGIQLKGETAPLRVQLVDLPALSKIFDHELYPFVLQLNPNTTYGFTIEPISFHISANRHLGYAIQWFTMALASLLYYLVINSRRLTHAKKSF